MRKQLYIVRFKVRGNGEFPFDMLRYDGCHPVNESEARCLGWTYALAEEPRGVIEIELQSRGRERYWEPCAARWQSFLWQVVPDSVEHHEHA